MSFKGPFKPDYFALFFRPPNITEEGSFVPSKSQLEWDCKCWDFGVLNSPPTSCLSIIPVSSLFRGFPPWFFPFSLQVCPRLSHLKGGRKIPFNHCLLPKAYLLCPFHSKTSWKSLFIGTSSPSLFFLSCSLSHYNLCSATFLPLHILQRSFLVEMPVPSQILKAMGHCHLISW